MTIHMRRAVGSEAKPLIGLYSESGCGKTKSALLIAKGFVGDMARVAMIETESGRGEVYADDPVVGGFNVLPIREEFSPKTYGACIRAAEKENIEALIIDSASHEWEGVGGVLSMAAERAKTMKGVLVWQQPKIDHSREFMLRLMQTPIPIVIVCMRARYPMYQVKPGDVEKWREAGKPGNEPKVGDWARSWNLDPKQSDDILFEMLVHGWIDQQHVFHGTKYTVESMQPVFIDGQPITVETGQRLKAWTRGRAAPRVDKTPVPQGTPVDKPEESQEGAGISARQAADLEAYCSEQGVPVKALLARAKVESIEQIPDFARAKVWIDAQVAARAAEADGAATRG